MVVLAIIRATKPQIFVLTVKTNQEHSSDIEDENSELCQYVVGSHAARTRLQNTNLTTLGMFVEGFFASPAVIPKLSVPPSIEIMDGTMISRIITTHRRS